MTAARLLWAGHSLAGYRYVAWKGSAWSTTGPYQVYVDGDRVVEVALDDSAAGIGRPDQPRSLFGPVEWLFALVESVPSENLTVDYDPEWGIPTSIRFDSPDCIDEEWVLGTESLEPYVGPLPIVEAPPPPDPGHLELAEAFSKVSYVVVGRVVGPVDISAEGCGASWVVAIEVEQAVQVGEAPPPPVGPRGRLLVADPAADAPRTLWGLEGARILLPLYFEAGPQGHYFMRAWAGVISEQGLALVGTGGALFDQELPYLCSSVPSAEPVDRRVGLPLLLAWAEAMAAGQQAEAARWQACGTFVPLPGI